MLTDEQIQKAGERFFWSFDEDAALFARAIEAAACAERDARIVEFERQLEEARKDAERYRWWRENRETTLVVAMFGNGCFNKTIEMIEMIVDASIKDKS